MDILNETQSISLKADFLPLTVLKLEHSNIDQVKQHLEHKIQQAPKYFNQTPIIIDIEKTSTLEILNLEQLCQLLKSLKIIPVGIRGLAHSQYQLAEKAGLPILKKAGHPKQTKPLESSKPTVTITHTPNKMITKPVRAGTQVYASGGDLIVTAAVNTGAECLADGNIHIYGPLRGKAIAGAQGNTRARIFCKSLDAELISIAGHYLIKEDLETPKTKKSMLQIYLENNKLKIEGI